MTWISAELNGFKGLSDKPIRLEQEEADNRDAHLYGEHEAREFCKLEELARNKSARLAGAFSRFCARREKAIATRFRAWLDELEEPGDRALGERRAAARVIPTWDLCVLEQHLLARDANASAGEREAWKLLLRFAVQVLRPAVLSGEHTVHTDQGEYFFRRRDGRSNGRYKYVLRISSDDGPVLKAGSQADDAKVAKLLRLSPHSDSGCVRVADLASRSSEALEILRTLFEASD